MADRAVVMVHGGNHGSWCWEAVITEMREQGYTGVIKALDVPGCGTKRGRDTTGMGIDSVAKELNAELRADSIGDALLLGHSMAGILLPRMVILDPSIFSEVCFVAASLPAEGEAVSEMLGAEERGRDATKVGWPLPLSAGMAAMFEKMFKPDMTDAQFATVLEHCREDQWPATIPNEPSRREGYPGTARVSYIVAERDPILPAAWQGRFAERAGAERLYAIDTPHEPFITHPRLLAALLIEIARGY